MAGRGKNIRRLVAGREIPRPSGGGSRVRLMAKYSYTPKPDRPGGFEEIELRQFQKVWLLKKGFGGNMLWWEVERDDGEKGFAPAQYLTIVEEGVSALPWLKKNPEPEMPNISVKSKIGPIKPYVPAYAENRNESTDYYCKLCERGFNGPIPFKAHVNSKAHKEEEMIAKEYN